MENKIEYIPYKQDDLIEKPLWFHKQGLQETVSGYGKKLTSSKMLKVGKRFYRIYVMCYGNSGSAYIVKNGKTLFLHDFPDC